MMDKAKHFYAYASAWAFPVLCVLLVYSILTCNGERTEKSNISKGLQTNEERSRQIENQNGRLVAMNEALLVTKENDLKNFTDTIFNLKEQQNKLVSQVTNYTKIVQDIGLKNKFARFVDTVTNTSTVYFEKQDSNKIKVPRAFAYSDSTLEVRGRVQLEGVQLDSIKIPNTVHVRTVTEKFGFLKLRRRSVIQVLNSNPAITSKVSSLTLEHKPTAWNKWLKPVIFGAAGFFLAKQVQ